jgi:hypothetical protein
MRKRDLGTELCLAVTKSDVQAVQQLVASGADVDALGDRMIPAVANSTPLWLAAYLAAQEISETWIEVCDGLRELCPQPSDHDASSKRSQLIAVAKILIDVGANLEMMAHGSTPLRVAVCGNDVEVVKLLLSRKANPNAETFSVLSKLARKQERKTLPAYYNTVLHEAVEKNSLPIVNALLVAGADPTRTDHEGKTPFNIAHEKGFAEIVAVLKQTSEKI